MTSNDASSVKRAFAYLDRDGDGYVTAADFNKTADSIAAAFNMDASSPKARRLHEGYVQTWEMLRKADSDNDGRITSDEFASAMSDLSHSKATATEMGNVCAAEFALADSDDDGVLTRAEFARLVAATGEPNGDVDAAFNALDSDGDGKISRAEYVAAWENYLVSDDPASRGNKVFAEL